MSNSVRHKTKRLMRARLKAKQNRVRRHSTRTTTK